MFQQTCKSSADPRNSVILDIFRVIFQICPDPGRKYFLQSRGGGPEKRYSEKCSQQGNISNLRYISNIKFE